jgi:hypothetical protein
VSGVLWRLGRYGSGALPDLAVGDLVVLDAVGGEYVFSKPGIGRVAALPVSATKIDHCPATTVRSDGSISHADQAPSPIWVSFDNRMEGLNVTLNPAPNEALLDPALETWMKERSLATAARK